MPAKTAKPPWADRIVDHGHEAPEKLLANPANWRRHPASQQSALASVLGEVGLVQSVIVNRTSGHLVDGHLRVELAIAAHQPQIPVVYVELSEDEERVILASLDPIAAMAEVDRDKLAELLEGIENEDLTELLESVARANRIALDLGAAGLCDPDEVPEPPAQPVSKDGDLWVLGDHRLLCGDATKPEDVQRLMDGARATLMATDPPYLVSYDGGNHPPTWANKGKAGDPDAGTKHWDAYVDHDTSVAFYEDFLRCAIEHALIETPVVYQWFGAMRAEVVFESWRKVGLLPHQMLVWHKTRRILSRCDFMWDYEPAMYGWRAGKRPAPERRPPANATAVWEVASGGDDTSGVHPTQKPVELIRRAIEYHARAGEVIYEPFSGSGTAIIAAEMTGRVCYAIELAPVFVDVAVERWRRFTGREPKLQAKEG